MDPVHQKVHVGVVGVLVGVDEHLVLFEPEPIDGLVGNLPHHLRRHLAPFGVLGVEGQHEVVDRLFAAHVLGSGSVHNRGRCLRVFSLQIAGFHPVHTVRSLPLGAPGQIQRRRFER